MKKQASLTKAMTDSEVRDFLSQNIHFIIKLQSWYRGNKARRKILFLKSKQIGSQKYFTKIEFQQIDHTDKSSVKKTFTFSTGAVYEGQMLKGKRNGYGVQKWPDGALYEGYWKDHKAEGKGKFCHPEGDIY